MAQALPKTQELADKIDQLLYKRRKPVDSEIRSLKKEASNLKDKIIYADYCDFLGGIACLENNNAKMIAHYKEAITLSFGNNYEIQRNYFANLNNRGLFAKAREQLKEITTKFPDTKELSIFSFGNAFFLCRFREAVLLSELLENIHDKEIARTAAFIFERENLSDDEAENLCKLAYSVLETKNLYFSGSEIEIIDNCILYTIYIDLPIEEVFDINWELAGVFVDNGKNRCNEVLAFKYSSVDVLEEKKKYEYRI